MGGLDVRVQPPPDKRQGLLIRQFSPIICILLNKPELLVVDQNQLRYVLVVYRPLLGLPSLVSSTHPPQPPCKVLRRRCCETRAEIHFDPLREVTGAGRTAGFIANRLGTVSRGFGRAHR